MLKKIILAAALLLVGLTIYGFFLPEKLNIEVNKKVSATKENLFQTVNDLSTWRNWDAWAMKDPQMKENFEGNSSGVGQIRSWESEVQEVGSGTQKIVQSIPFSYIETTLVFSPDQPESKGYWKFKDLENGTDVVWGFTYDIGKNPYMRLISHWFIKPVIEKSFEQGLNNLEQYLSK